MRILERDWRCRLGQIDLIAEDAGVLVVVEVKARLGTGFGLPQEAVGWRKQAKLRTLTEVYRSASGRSRQPYRIDVVGVLLNAALRPARIDHIRNAVGGR